MLPSQSTSTDIVPWAVTSPSGTWESPLTSQPAGIKTDQVPRAWSPAAVEVAMRRLLFADGLGLETNTSNVGLNGPVALESDESFKRKATEARVMSKTRKAGSRRRRKVRPSL